MVSRNWKTVSAGLVLAFISAIAPISSSYAQPIVVAPTDASTNAQSADHPGGGSPPRGGCREARDGTDAQCGH